MTDSAPGSRLSPNLPPALAEPPAEPVAPSPPPAPDAKPKRPTTRAGRAAAAAVRKAEGKAEKAPKSKTPTPRKSTLETRLTGSLVTLGSAVTVAGSMTNPAVQADGVAIVQHAPSIAAALDKVAANDPKVKAALERMLTAGVWSGLIAATLPLVLTIAGNHGAIPANVAQLLGAPAEPQAPEADTSTPGAVGIV